MSTRVALAVSFVILVAALGSTWRSFREIKDLGLKLHGARNEVSALKVAFAESRQTARHKGPETKLPVIRASAVAQVQTTGGFSEEALHAQAQKIAEERKTALLASPSLQVLFEESRRGSYRGLFAALFQRLKLSPDQQAAFITALVAWDMKSNDLEAVMRQQGLSRNDPALKAQRAEAEAALIHDVQAVLGPDALKITQEYTRLQDARSYVAGYGGLFSRLGQPLTFSQFEALTNAFGEASPTEPPQPSRFTTAQWDQIAAQAQGILSPSQWQVFQSTTPPGQTAGRWDSTATEAMAKATEASGMR